MKEGLEKSKVRLKAALVELERAIEAKIARLELENQALKSELMARAEKGPAIASRKKPVKNDAVETASDGLMSETALNEIDLSLKELKKLVG